MTLKSPSRIALGLALPFAVNAVPPIIAKEKRRTSASVDRENQWATLLDCASRFIFSPLSLLRRSGCRDCVFPFRFLGRLVRKLSVFVLDMDDLGIFAALCAQKNSSIVLDALARFFLLRRQGYS
jgi:hypothetical protein